MSKFGLSGQVINEITAVLERYPQVQKALIYGSRATGTYRTGSDIDLTLFGGEQLIRDVMLLILSDIEEAMIPHFVDLSLFNEIQNESLKQKIRKEGIVFYERNPLQTAQMNQ